MEFLAAQELRGNKKERFGLDMVTIKVNIVIPTSIRYPEENVESVPLWKLGFASQEGVILDAKDLKRKNPFIRIAEAEHRDIAHGQILSLADIQTVIG